MTTEDFKRKLTAILSADVVGYSRLMGEDEAATVKTLETYKGVMFSLIKQHRGRVVDSPGDNLLAEFGSVVDAVQCAVSIQKELQTRNAGLSENRRMEFRIGINLGDVIEEDNRIYGDGVNIAARLEALADPGGICISKTAFDYIENKLPFGYRFIGEQTVKNIAKPVGAYKVLMETRLIDEEEQRAKAPIWKRKAVLSIGIVVILAIAGTLYWNFYLRGPSTESASVEPEQAPAASEVKEAPKTIAVLPFDDISPNKDQEYFVLGLSEEILNSISKISGLHVTSKTSSFAFKDTDKTIKEIAEILARDYILEGSVRKAGDSLRITSQLIDVADDRHFWSETYDRELKDIFEIQEDIANRVADKLELTLEAFQLSGGTEDIGAYELYLKAKGNRAEGTVSGIRSAIEALDEAIALDPEFALAWAFKAHNHILLNVHGPSNRSIEEINAATKAALKAIEIEPNLEEAYFNLGYVKSIKGEWINAERNYQKALELIDKPLSGYNHCIAIFYTAVGNFKKSLEFLDEMKRNDPKHPDILAWYYFIYGLLGDRQRAEKEYQQRDKSMPKGHIDWHDQAITFVRVGSGDVLSFADIIASRMIHNAGKKFLNKPEEGLIELNRIYKSDENLSSSQFGRISIWAAYFGDYEFAMKVAEKAISTTAEATIPLWYPVMKEVRQLPRFKEFTREIGLVDYWKEYGWPDLCRPVGDDDFVCD